MVTKIFGASFVFQLALGHVVQLWVLRLGYVGKTSRMDLWCVRQLALGYVVQPWVLRLGYDGRNSGVDLWCVLQLALGYVVQLWVLRLGYVGKTVEWIFGASLNLHWVRGATVGATAWLCSKNCGVEFSCVPQLASGFGVQLLVLRLS